MHATAPLLLWAVPLTQYSHDEAPEREENEPGLHSSQLAALFVFEDEPAAHGWHEVCAVRLLYRPGKHASQERAPSSLL